MFQTLRRQFLHDGWYVELQMGRSSIQVCRQLSFKENQKKSRLGEQQILLLGLIT